MSNRVYIHWLRLRLWREGLNGLLLGAFLLVVGSVLLSITWAMAYMASVWCLGLCLAFGLGHWIHAANATAIVPLLFWGNARTSQEYLTDYSVTLGTASQDVKTLARGGWGHHRLMNPLAPNTVHSVAKVITDCLYFGPRVVCQAFGLLARSTRLARIDCTACATVLAVLTAEKHRLSDSEIITRAQLADPARAFDQLRLIDGVMFLHDPAGLALSDELKATLGQQCRRNATR